MSQTDGDRGAVMKHDSLSRWTLIAPAAITLVLTLAGLGAERGLTRYYAIRQDLPLLLLGLVILAFAAFRPDAGAAPPKAGTRRIGLLAAVLGLIAYVGHYLVLLGYSSSRDEQLADFDSRIFASGKLIEPLAEQWRDRADLLNVSFLTPVSHPGGLVSAYLPGNAALRALLGLIGDAALTGPLLLAGSIGLLWFCARRIWPDNREPAIVAVAMLALSGQALFAAMTAYAMPAHLFFNLLWLALFQRDRRISDFAALAAGFIATGLHQPVFHPLFVAPWLALLLVERRWGRATCFAMGYAAIGLFWLGWPAWIGSLVTTPASITGVEGTDYLARLRFLIQGNEAALPLMADNLLRFFVWQHVLLLPLLCAAAMALRHDRRALALAGGLVLTLAAMALLLPYQGHGFGYRYFHGLLGSTALLAGFGWQRLAPVYPALRGVLIRSSAAVAVLVLPVQAWFAHGLYAPYARISAQLNASGADYVLLSSKDAAFSADLVLNRADLSNRPLRLDAMFATDPQALATWLCRSRPQVALPSDRLYVPVDAIFATQPSGEANARAARWTPLLTAAGCTVKKLE